MVFIFLYKCVKIQHVVIWTCMLTHNVKMNKVMVSHGDTVRKFPVYEIYLDGVIVTKVSSEKEAIEMISRWQEAYK